MVGFEEEDVDALEGGLDVGGHVAEVSGEGHADAVGGEDEAAGVGCVVGNGEGGDVDVADAEVGAGVEELDGGEVGGVGFGGGRKGVGVAECVGFGFGGFGIESGGFGVDVGDGGGRGGDVVGLSGYGCGAGFFFALDVIEPLGVGHGGARGHHADPGAVGWLGEVDRDVEAAGEDAEAGDVVLVLVGDEDGVELRGIFAGYGHAFEEFAAGETSVDEDAGAGGRDDCAVALGPGG